MYNISINQIDDQKISQSEQFSRNLYRKLENSYPHHHATEQIHKDFLQRLNYALNKQKNHKIFEHYELMQFISSLYNENKEYLGMIKPSLKIFNTNPIFSIESLRSLVFEYAYPKSQNNIPLYKSLLLQMLFHELTEFHINNADNIFAIPLELNIGNMDIEDINQNISKVQLIRDQIKFKNKIIISRNAEHFILDVISHIVTRDESIKKLKLHLFDITKEQTDILTNIIRDTETVTHLDLSLCHNKMSCSTSHIIERTIDIMHNISYGILGGVNALILSTINDLKFKIISVPGLILLSLSSESALQALTKYYQPINDEQLGLITEAISYNKSLTHLTINNEMGYQGAQHIARMIETNENLIYFSLMIDTALFANRCCGFLHANYVTFKMIKLIIDEIGKSKSLQTVSFDNSIGDKGAKYIIDMLEVNNTLTEINISQTDTSISHNLEEEIESMLDHNRLLASNQAVDQKSVDLTIDITMSDEKMPLPDVEIIGEDNI